MAVKPKFYPILPREKRQKRQRSALNDSSSSACSYRLYQWHESTSRITHSTSFFVDNDYTATIGWNAKTGVKLPNWKQLVAKGMDATTPYAREVYSVKPARYTVGSTNAFYVNVGAGLSDGGLLKNEKEWDTLRDQALARLKNKLNGHIGKAQLAAPLAESREVHRLVRQINTLGIDMVKAALAIKKTRGKSAAKFFGDVWLGFGFGVRPLISDLANAANAILDYQTREDHHVRVVGTATREYTSGQVIAPVYSICPGVKIGYTNHGHHMQGVHLVAGIDLKIRSTASYGMSDQLGLSLGAVPGALWELVPFSWVVDYASTVGDWIDDMFFTIPGIVKYVSRSEKYQTETTGVPYASYSPGYTGSFSSSPAELKYVNFNRTVLATLPTRQLRLKTTDEVAKFGLTKLLNLASVLAQKRGPNLKDRLS
jgi:hypothetical protein